ncbi:MAG: SLC13 family permease [Acetobacteraceae bacterium]
MPNPQFLILLLLAVILGLMLWGRIRHDLVAAGGLLTAVALGLVPSDAAFSGFANPAVIIVALALIASRALENCGLVGLLSHRILGGGRSLATHIALLGGVAACLSAVINNVAALALLMPIDIQAARKAGRSPHLTLMPLSFATILGGTMTLIGTPPNIIAASMRARDLGAPYQMFDFLPVGLSVTAAGLAFIALVGWRLIPHAGRDAPPVARGDEFIADLRIPAASSSIGRPLGDLTGIAADVDIIVIGLVRDGHPLVGEIQSMVLRADDVVIVEGATEGIVAFMERLQLQRGPARDPDSGEPLTQAAPPVIAEVAVRGDSPLIGESARTMQLRSRHGITILGIYHQGRSYRRRIRDYRIDPGDVLLLATPQSLPTDVLDLLGLLPTNEVALAPHRPWATAAAVGLFGAGILAAGLGWLPFAVALAMVVVAYAAIGLVPAREVYARIDWSIIVMLACLLPLGSALETTGGIDLIAWSVLRLTHGQPPVVALAAVMVLTMLLSSVLNNVATIVIVGPLAISIANSSHVNPDTFLMGAAVATSCAFMSPLSHKNNTLIMGPGGYGFGDYWQLGVPLQLIALGVGIPVLMVVFPL